MYPLNVVLAGNSEAMAIDVRRELDAMSAGVEAVYPDVSDALNGLPTLSLEKRVLILHIKSAADLKQLERLTGIWAALPIVALVEPDQDPSLLLKAMRAGASQVVPLPLQAEDFQAAMHRIGVQFGRPPTESRVIAVSGSSEGCGATTVAINLAHEIATAHHQPVILAELATHLGRLASYLNIEPHYSICDLLGDIERVDQEAVRRALTRVSDRLAVLAGPFEAIVSATPPTSSVVQLLQYLRQLGGVLVLDLPYCFDDTYFEVLAQAQRVVLIGDQKVPAMHALRLVLDMLARKEITATTHVVVNRYDPSVAEFTVEQVKKQLSVAKVLTIANDYPNLVASANEGKPLREIAPNCRALSDIDKLAVALVGPLPSAHKRSLLSRLVHPFAQA